VSGIDTPGNLTGPQLLAIGSLLAGGTPEEAAAAAKVSVRTLRRWQAMHELQEALREFSRAIFRDSHSLLQAASKDAVAKLWEVTRTGDPATAIRAAAKILELGLKVADDDWDERLERLEQLERAWQASEAGTNGLRLLSG
jgi:hypothetical protein